MRLSLGKASPWKIHPDTTAEKNGRRQRDHMHVNKNVGKWKMTIYMCFSVDSSSPNGGDHPQKVGFDDYGMPIPSASAVSKLTTQQWRSMRKSTRDHVFDVPCSCRKNKCLFCANRNHAIPLDSWYDNDNDEPHNFHLRARSLIIQMETITHFYIALFFSSCTFQTEEKHLEDLHPFTVYIVPNSTINRSLCSLSKLDAGLILALHRQHRAPQILTRLWVSCFLHKLLTWQRELSNFFAIQQRICITHHAVLLASPGSSSVTCQA